MKELESSIALRIALAAKVLPDISVGQLVDVLHELLSSPLNDKKLKKITTSTLKEGIKSMDDELELSNSQLESAVQHLWAEEASTESMPVIKPYVDGDMPNSLRIAVASNNAELLNGHFGSCIRFLVYQLSKDEIRLIDIRSTAKADMAEDSNLFRAKLIEDCHIIFLQSVGGPAAVKVIRADIYPIKVPITMDAMDKLIEFQAVLDAPPPWVAKILGVSAENRKRFEYAEDDA